MQVVEAGYSYVLQNLGDRENKTGGQVINFFKKSKEEDERETVGTSTEEVLNMLVERLKFLDKINPSIENKIAIQKIIEAEMWLERRNKNKNRMKRKLKANDNFTDLEEQFS